MKKTILVLAITLLAGAAKAVELEKITAAGVAQLAQERQVPAAAVPVPVAGEARKTALPITAAVGFKSPAFAELLVNSLKVKPEHVAMAGGTTYMYKVGDGLVCYKSFPSGTQPSNGSGVAHYSCYLLPEGGWKLMGREAYGSGAGRDFSLALYEALKVKSADEGGMRIKTLELDAPDQNGGAARSQLSCMNPGPEIAGMGFRPACEFVNGL